MTTVTIPMPNLGQTTAEGSIASWEKAEGEWVDRGDVLAEVETDKAMVPVEAFASGFLRRILEPAGSLVSSGRPIALLTTTADELIEERAATSLSESPIPPSGSDGAAEGGGRPTSGHPVLATPTAHRLARELHVDLTRVIGSGPGGRILVDDVKTQADEARTIEGNETAVESPESDVEATDGANLVELSSRRRATALRMVQSVQETPQFSLSLDVDLTEVERLRARRAPSETARPSYTALLVKVVANALRHHPEVNVSFEEGRLRRHRTVHVGVAVATPTGLVAPVIRNADRLSLAGCHEAITALQTQATEGRLPAAALGGGTFTVSNLGMYGIDRFTAILNPPEAGILAVGRVVYRPVSLVGSIESRPLMTLTLTVDHRALDGAEAALFLRAIGDLLENPFDLL